MSDRIVHHSMNEEQRKYLAYPMYKPQEMNTGIKSQRDKAPDSFGIPFNVDAGKSAVEMQSPINRRSFNFSQIEGKVVWGDQFGGNYMSKTIKGYPPVDKDPILSNTEKPIRFDFLLPRSDAEHAQSVSGFLRKMGVRTERIVEINKITHINYKGAVISVDELKKRLFEDRGSEVLISSEEYKKTADGVEFVYVVRDLPINARFEDVFQALGLSINSYILKREDGRFDYMDGTFSEDELLNILSNGNADERDMAERIKNNPNEDVYYTNNLDIDTLIKQIFSYINNCDSQEFKFDYQDKSHIEEYLSQYLPRQMGKSLGQFHGLGLTHGYPHRANFLATGHLIDLDSVKGAEFGDPAPTATNFEDEYRQLRSSVESLYSPHKYILTDRLGKDHQLSGYLTRLLGVSKLSELQHKALKALHESYLRAKQDIRK